MFQKIEAVKANQFFETAVIEKKAFLEWSVKYHV